MMIRQYRIVGFLATVLTAASWLVYASAAATTFHVVASKSRAQISVGKSGALSFAAGHTHEVAAPVESGVVDLDPRNPAQSRVRLLVRASALEVQRRDEPAADVPKIQEAMLGDKVLDAARFPTITFQSSSIQIRSEPRGTAGGDDDTFDLTVAGALTIHGTTQPVTAPVHVRVAGGSLTATGRLSVKQTSFGIKPITVGGVVSVKDALEISFTIVAHR